MKVHCAASPNRSPCVIARPRFYGRNVAEINQAISTYFRFQIALALRLTESSLERPELVRSLFVRDDDNAFTLPGHATKVSATFPDIERPIAIPQAR